MSAYESDIPTQGATVYRGAQKRTSWGAIFAGTLIVLGVQVLLGALGAAIGLTALTINPGEGTAKGVGIGGAIWWILTGLIALFAGGWVAGRVSGLYQRMEGVLHGAVMWALASLASVVLVTTAIGAVVGGAWNVLSTTATTAAQTSDQVSLNQQGATPGQVGEGARQAAEQAPRVASETAKKAAGPSAAAAWGIFAMMLLGLAAAGAGGASGVKAEIKADRRPGMAAAA